MFMNTFLSNKYTRSKEKSEAHKFTPKEIGVKYVTATV